jgi:hypothetical protein
VKLSGDAGLARECDVFCRYLLERPCDPYVLEKYALAHRVTPHYAGGTRFDALLLRLAAAGPFGTHVADSYACLLARSSVLRRKLILLAAILESCSAAHGFEEGEKSRAPLAVYAGMLARSVAFGLRLALAAIPLLPLQILLDRAGPGRER